MALFSSYNNFDRLLLPPSNYFSIFSNLAFFLRYFHANTHPTAKIIFSVYLVYLEPFESILKFVKHLEYLKQDMSYRVFPSFRYYIAFCHKKCVKFSLNETYEFKKKYTQKKIVVLLLVWCVSCFVL